MKHYTSYYANYSNIPKDYMCIGISRVCPDWLAGNISNFSFFRHNVLAPSEYLLTQYKAGKVSEEEYKKIYITELLTAIQTEFHEKDISTWLDKVDNFYAHECSNKWDAIVFMCYEAPHQFCHRHLLRRLLTNVYHIPCEEYGVRPTEVWGEIPKVQGSKELF